jgi:hypothetical protein
MAKGRQELLMEVPPDGGEWTIMLRSGRAYKGLLMARYDNAIIIQPRPDIIQAIMKEEIETMWQGSEEPVKEAPKEA